MEIESKLIINPSEDNFTKKDLAMAVRRFISRYLAGKSEEADINENRDLAYEIEREDLWDEEILEKVDLQIAVGERIRKFKLKVGQAYEFYKLINQKDKQLIEEYEINKQKKRGLKKEEVYIEKDKIDELLYEKDTNIKKSEIIKEEIRKKQREIYIKDESKTLNENKEINEKIKEEKNIKKKEEIKEEIKEEKKHDIKEEKNQEIKEGKISLEIGKEENKSLVKKEEQVVVVKGEFKKIENQDVEENRKIIKNKEEKLKIKPIKLKGKKEEIEMEKIKLLFNLIIQECSYLKKIASESDNSLISVNELLDMEKCTEFIIDLGNLNDLTIKENISKSEYENILIQFNKFIINYGHMKALQTSLVESFIKKAKEFIENGFSILLKNKKFEKIIEEKDNNNKVNNFINNSNEILSYDKNDSSSKLFFEEEKELFNTMSNYFQKINNNLKNNEAILKKKNEELNEIINKLKSDLEKEKEINNNLNLNIKKLEIEIKDKEKELNEEKRQKNDLIKKINNINNTSQNSNMFEFIKKIQEEKENEIKEFKKILPFEYKIGEKILIITFLSINEDIHFSMLCKNTDEFYKLKIMFYNKYPEYKKGNNIFLIHGKEIDEFNDLDSNEIRDNDIIIFKQKN